MSVSHVEQKAKLERALKKAKDTINKQKKEIATQKTMIAGRQQTIKDQEIHAEGLVEGFELRINKKNDYIEILIGDVEKQFIQLDNRRIEGLELRDAIQNRDAEIMRLHKAIAYLSIELSNK